MERYDCFCYFLTLNVKFYFLVGKDAHKKADFVRKNIHTLGVGN